MGGFGHFTVKPFSRAFFRQTISSMSPHDKKFRKTFVTLIASFSLFASLAVGIAPVYAATCGPCANTAMTLTFGGMPAGGATVFLPLDSTLNTIQTSNNGSNNVYIQWGDGAANLVTGQLAVDVPSMTHTYATAGPFTVSVTEQNTASLLGFGIGPQNAAWATTYGSTHTNWTGAQYLTSVSAWNGFTNLNGAFYGATTLTSVPTSLPSAGVTDLAFAFYGDSIFNSGNVTGWTTSSVTNLSSMFQNATAFNQNISAWNTVAVTTTSSMFQNATNFNDNSVAMNTSGSSWKTSVVTNMASMFQGANHFNQNINLWDTHLVTDMSSMFQGATIFNDGGSANALSTSGNVWNVGVVTTFANMFNGDSSFNIAVNNWVPAVPTTMASMFQGATSFNQNITSWDTHLVTNMSSMFQGATAFNNLGVALTRSSNLWNTVAVTTMASMFAGATGFNQSINNWNTVAVSNMTSMFDGATIFNQDISLWNVQSVLNMQYIFRSSAENANLAAWNVTGIASTSNGLNLWQTGSFSVINYSSTLVGWAAEAVQSSVNAVVSGSTFYNQAGLIARNTLIGAGKTWTISGDSAYGITASLASTGGTSLGSTIVFTATVTGTNAPNVAPTAPPTWTISGGQVTSCTSTAGPSTTLLVSTYTCSITATNVGSYTANFSYPGDNYYIAVSAGPQTVSPGKVNPGVLVVVNSTVQALGTSEIFTATVTGSAGATAPTGIGTWSFVGTGSPSAAVCNSNTGPTPVSNVTSYKCTVVDTQAGTYTAQFAYPGDGNYNSVVPTGTASTTVAKATATLAVSPNAATAFPNTSLTFTGTITVPVNAVALCSDAVRKLYRCFCFNSRNSFNIYLHVYGKCSRKLRGYLCIRGGRQFQRSFLSRINYNRRL
jgi:surface protein